jgi:hypothetical protein
MQPDLALPGKKGNGHCTVHTICKFDKFYLPSPACGRVLFRIQNLNLNNTSSLQSVSVRIMLRIPWLAHSFLLVVALCMGASIVHLDQKVVASWMIPSSSCSLS